MDLYKTIGEEIRSLFEDMFSLKSEKHVMQRLDHIAKLAAQIGEPMKEEVAKLRVEVDQFLKHRENPAVKEALKERAQRLSGETRDL